MNIQELKDTAARMLEEDILSFWMQRMQDEAGAFHGGMDGYGNVIPDAPRGSILYGRVLWTFSRAYQMTGRRAYLEVALRVKEYLLHNFVDEPFGGVYWTVDRQGKPLNTKKQAYAIAFVIYGMSELARVTGDSEALRCARTLYESLEEHIWDPEYGGYLESTDRAWNPILDMRLSEKDQNTPFSMNTHLHILEAYTGLYAAWRDSVLGQRLKELVEIFSQRIIRPETHHLGLFFDRQWKNLDEGQSFGHDIEASWLLKEALEVLGDDELTRRTELTLRSLVTAAEEGLLIDGSLAYSRSGTSGPLDEERHWWVQCECVVGELYRWEAEGSSSAWQRAERCFSYIRHHLMDPQNGEMYWSILPDGTPNLHDEKAGFWKCPYHNGRMCMEILKK